MISISNGRFSNDPSAPSVLGPNARPGSESDARPNARRSSPWGSNARRPIWRLQAGDPDR